MSRSTPVTINRAPVLTLWAAVVAERLGYDWDEAVTLGRAVAGLNAATKARNLGITRADKAKFERSAKAPAAEKAATVVELCHRHVPIVRTPQGVRAATDGKPTAPESVHRYLAAKFGDSLADVRAAMTALAKSLPTDELAAESFALYESFRPQIPRGVGGWGAKGVLDLGLIRAMARERS